jgi:fructose-1-phosphate kinase PfkB-like protein
MKRIKGLGLMLAALSTLLLVSSCAIAEDGRDIGAEGGVIAEEYATPVAKSDGDVTYSVGKQIELYMNSKKHTSDLLDEGFSVVSIADEEIATYSGREVNDFADCLDFAKSLLDGGIENVMISLGEKGAVLVTDEGAVGAIPPSIHALSTIGAGDSTIAGFIAAYCEGRNAAERLRVAVSYGSAACLLEGTTPPTKENVAEIYKDVKLVTL